MDLINDTFITILNFLNFGYLDFSTSQVSFKVSSFVFQRLTKDFKLYKGTTRVNDGRIFIPLCSIPLS